MKAENLLALIKKRRSAREFKNKEVSQAVINNSLEAGRWAPSGLNNQPWRFKVLAKKKKDSLAEYTKYSRVIKGADKLILVFLDKESSYNYKKDLMAMGAAIQNMLLYFQAEGLGACWLGEILKRAKEVETELSLPAHLEFVAAIAVGIPQSRPVSKQRKPLHKLILK